MPLASAKNGGEVRRAPIKIFGRIMFLIGMIAIYISNYKYIIDLSSYHFGWGLIQKLFLIFVLYIDSFDRLLAHLPKHPRIV